MLTGAKSWGCTLKSAAKTRAWGADILMETGSFLNSSLAALTPTLKEASLIIEGYLKV